MKMTNKEFHVIITGVLCLILGVNILMKYFYHNPVTEYVLDMLFFTVFGIGISDFIQKLILNTE